MMEINQEWVDSLKVGDKVAMEIGSYRSLRYVIATIEKITPTRIIKTSNGRSFNKDGRERGKSSTWDRESHLEPVTEKIREFVERERLLNTINNMKFEEMSLVSLRKIVELKNIN